MDMLKSRLPAPDPGGSYGRRQRENDTKNSLSRVTTAFNTGDSFDTALVLASMAPHHRHLINEGCAVLTDQGQKMIPAFSRGPPVLWTPGDSASCQPAVLDKDIATHQACDPRYGHDKPGIESPMRRSDSPVLTCVNAAHPEHTRAPMALSALVEDYTPDTGCSELDRADIKAINNELCGERSFLNLPTSLAFKNMAEVASTDVAGQGHAPSWLLAALAMVFFTRQPSKLFSVESNIISSPADTLVLTAMLLTSILGCTAAPKNYWSWLVQTGCLLEDPG